MVEPLYAPWLATQNSVEQMEEIRVWLLDAAEPAIVWRRL